MLLSVAYTMPFQSRAFCDLQYAIFTYAGDVYTRKSEKMGKNRNIAINWECKCLFNYEQVYFYGNNIVYYYVTSCCRLELKKNN